MSACKDIPLFSVVVTTKDEERCIGQCLESIRKQTYSRVESIVVDNGSTDDTVRIAKDLANVVEDFGPERSAQRNHGMLSLARGAYVMFVDADMTLSETLVAEAVEMFERDPALVGLYVPLRWEGNNWINRARGFEREFYDATMLDAVRIVRADVAREVGGFDCSLLAGEDWDFDRRVRAKGAVSSIGSVMWHHENPDFGLRDLVGKMAYYAPSLDAYVKKWGRADPEVQKQFGILYRGFTVFVENGKWRKALRHPLRSCSMYFAKTVMALAYFASRKPRSE